MNRRKFMEKFMLGLICLLAAFSALPLFYIIATVYARGLAIISINFLIEPPPPPSGEISGGIGPSLVGSLILIGLATLIGGGLGFFTGLFLSEYSHLKFADYTRLILQLMVEFPTIIVGLFAYTILVIPLRRFNALAGAFALALVILPYVALHVREAYSSIPYQIKEAAYSLGISPFTAYLRILLGVARRGVLTAILTGMSRAAGETAPLLFTILGTTLTYFTGLDKPVGAMPLLIYNFALSPSTSWHEIAWGTAAILLTIILTLSILARKLIKGVRV